MSKSNILNLDTTKIEELKDSNSIIDYVDSKFQEMLKDVPTIYSQGEGEVWYNEKIHYAKLEAKLFNKKDVVEEGLPLEVITEELKQIAPEFLKRIEEKGIKISTILEAIAKSKEQGQ